jgi:hypothetical protein
LKLHTYLVCNKGVMDDFELRFSFRCIAYQNNDQPNSGVEYRASRSGNAPFKGYQFEINRNPKEIGAVSDDQGRKFLAKEGNQVVAGVEGNRDLLKTIGTITEKAALDQAFRKDDWNDGIIIASGNRLIHKLNGRVIGDVVDEHKAKSHRSGLLALELYMRNTNNPAIFVQFKNLRLKTAQTVALH